MAFLTMKWRMYCGQKWEMHVEGVIKGAYEIKKTVRSVGATGVMEI